MEGRGRNNNINLLRLLAALAVVVSHSFAIATGDVSSQPLKNSLGLSLGEIAVDVFFVLSGYLVTRSAIERSTRGFIEARVRRIYPAAVVSTLVTVAVAGLFFSDLQMAQFLADPLTAWHLLKNITLISGASYALPSTFMDNPYSGVVNGSLWSISLELQVYLVLALLAAALKFANVEKRAWKAAALLALGVAACMILLRGNEASSVASARAIFMFAAGSGLFLFNQRGQRWTWWPVIPVLATAVLDHLFMLAYLVCLPLLVVWIAYARVLGGNRVARGPDYSLGIYLYAFPAQQAIVSAVPDIHPGQLVATTLATVMPLAVISWHVLERPLLSGPHFRGFDLARSKRAAIVRRNLRPILRP